MPAEYLPFLKRMPCFSLLPDEQLLQVVQHLNERSYPAGTLLAEKNQTQINHIYIVKKGQLSLYDPRPSQRALTGYIKAGEVFGGLSLIMNGGFSLRTVVVDVDTDFYLLDKSAFLDLCTRNKNFHEHFLANFSKHLFDPELTALIVAGQVRLFLSTTEPFSFLDEETIERVASKLTMVKHAKGSVLFIQGRSRVGYLYILSKGAAERYYERDGRKTINDILSEGDVYGGISMLINDGISVRTLEVTEDAFFYLLPKNDFLELCQKHPAFSDFFTDTFGKRMIDKTYASIVARSAAPLEDQTRFLNLPVGQLLSKATVCQTGDISIQQAAQAMRDHNSSYIIIPSSPTHGAGLITDSDLARKAIANGYDYNQSALEIMSSPLHGVNHQAIVLDAMLAMLEHDIKHIAVFDNDQRIVGMLTNRELIAAQGQSPLFILRKIIQAESPDEIIQQQQQLPTLIKFLIAGGAKARDINRFITKVSDTILQKTMAIVLRELPQPPAAFCFMIMGSEGREEQTLKTDQDNAIIFANVPAAQLPAVQAYFLQLGEKVCDMLDKVGYSYCPGDIMARNPRWCKPLAVWQNYFFNWLNASESADLLRASIFFDFRGGFGDLGLVGELRRSLFAAIEEESGFLRFLSENAISFKPPLGFFRNFVVESKGQHRNSFDIKGAMLPMVDFARVFALKSGIESTNTLERVHSLYLKKVLSLEEYEEFDKAYSFLMQLRLMRQVTAIVEQKQAPDNFINPKKLTRIEQTMLKEIFKRIEKFQAMMRVHFFATA